METRINHMNIFFIIDITVMGWSIENKNRCKVIGDRAGAHVWISNQAAEHYEYIDSVLELILTILLFLFGGGGISTLLVIQDLDNVKLVNLIIQSLVILTGLLSAVKKWLDYKKTIKRLNWYSAKCTELFLDIEKNLNKKQSSSKFPKYYKEVQKKAFVLQKEMPYIPEKIIKKYYSRFKTQALNHEVLFNTKSTKIEFYAQQTPTKKQLESEMKKQGKIRKEHRKQSLNYTEKKLMKKSDESSVETEFMDYSEKATPKDMDSQDDDPSMIKIDMSKINQKREFRYADKSTRESNNTESDNIEITDFDIKKSLHNSQVSPMRLHIETTKRSPSPKKSGHISARNETLESMRKSSPKKDNLSKSSPAKHTLKKSDSKSSFDNLNSMFPDDIKRAIRRKRAKSINEKRRYELERYFI